MFQSWFPKMYLWIDDPWQQSQPGRVYLPSYRSRIRGWNFWRNLNNFSSASLDISYEKLSSGQENASMADE
jgi:hypothetical protein